MVESIPQNPNSIVPPATSGDPPPPLQPPRPTAGVRGGGGGGLVSIIAKRPTLRVTSEFDSDSSVYFHKISCKLLENLAKLKLTFQNNSKGEVAEPQLSFVSKYLSLDYDVEEQNALVKGSFDLGPSLHLRATRDVKVRFENKGVIHNGIVCLNPKVITVLGGVVQSLYEEWQMNQKYSGFSRTSLKSSQNGDSGGPPPFEKLQVGAPLRRTQHGKFSQLSRSSSKSSDPAFVEKGHCGSRHSSKLQHSDLKLDNMNNDVMSVCRIEINEGNTPCSESRPKEVAESIPVQNQAAAQKQSWTLYVCSWR